jgi:hypothetical protein
VWAGDVLIKVEAVVEVAIITITIMVTVAMYQPMRVRCVGQSRSGRRMTWRQSRKPGGTGGEWVDGKDEVTTCM